MLRIFYIKSAASLALVSIIVLAALPVENSEADRNPQSQELSIGKSNLPESRTNTKLAVGVTHVEITRGYGGDQKEYTVEAGFTDTKDKAKSLAASLKESGYQTKIEKVHNLNRKYTDVEDDELGYIVQIGTFNQEQEAEELAEQATAAGFEDATVTYSEFDGSNKTTGPWQLNVIEIDPDQFEGEIASVLANDKIKDRETVSSIASRHEAIAGVNGGYFVESTNDGVPGDPAGGYMIDGRLASEAIGERTSLLLSNNEAEVAEISTHVSMETEDGSTAVIDGINRKPGLIRSCGGLGDEPAGKPMHDVTCTDSSEIIQFNKIFGDTTPAGEGYEMIVNEAGEVVETYSKRGHPIPEEGVVLSATGEQAVWLEQSVSNGDELILTEEVVKNGETMTDLSGLNIVGGGPQLVNNGSIDIQAKEEGFRWSKDFYYRFAETRHPRSLAGIKEDGNILLVTADGRNPDESLGLTFYESAQVLQSLGAVEGMNLDGGGSTTMVVEDELVNLPSDPGGERPVSDGIFLLE